MVILFWNKLQITFQDESSVPFQKNSFFWTTKGLVIKALFLERLESRVLKPNGLETKSLNCNVIYNQNFYTLLIRVKRSPRNTQIFTPNKPKIVFADFEE